MSEEKPSFKVTDRRLFNADGTPREIEREEPAHADESNIIGHSATASPNSAAAGDSTRTGASRSSASNAPPPKEPRPAASRNEPDEFSAAAGDPMQFANLVMFIASPAAAALGMTEHPGRAPGEVDLPLAKHCIDLLGALEQKTHGNLNTQEEEILEGLLAELRMQYVSLAGARPATGARGFTGSDITGGR